MSILSEQQKKRAIEAFREYISAPAPKSGIAPLEEGRHLDSDRFKLIESNLKPLVKDYLAEKVKLPEFKTKIDSINKRNPLWGFKGIKGQMFFNVVINVSENEEEADHEIKSAITLPQNEEIAASRIRTFESYVKRIGQTWVENGGSLYGRPKIGSVPFFLSYFWQIQNHDVWPVYYTNTVQVMTDMNLFQPSENLANDYITYKHIQEELAELFSKESGKKQSLYDVEHVFWFKGGNPRGDEDTKEKSVIVDYKPAVVYPPASTANITALPESYIPPIVSILPLMARNLEQLNEAAKRSGTNLNTAFEKYVDAAFTILGYETKLLGQGMGRVPDGLVKSTDDNYAILWDAKVRSDYYSMGTDDRTIREYITTQSKQLKKSLALKNIYYMIISSRFSDDFDDAVSSIKMETDVNEVILVEAEALVAMVDIKLRSPLLVSLGPDGFQRLFAHGGILTAERVREEFA